MSDKTAARLTGENPRIEVITVPGANHNIHFAHFDAFMPLLRESSWGQCDTMRHSEQRILVSHAGNLPRPPACSKRSLRRRTLTDSNAGRRAQSRRSWTGEYRPRR